MPTGPEDADRGPPAPPLELSRIARTWRPLAASWLLMGFELPALSAVVARLPDPAVHLAAVGGVVFPLCLVIESPIIMLLSASTALSRDRGAYLKLRRFMHGTSAVLTALHALVAYTPLYDLVLLRILHVPAPVREPARWGLRIMLPWTWSIAYRRFHQGVLIRFGRPREVGLGSAVRISTNCAVLAAGVFSRAAPGIVVATAAVASGVVAEAVYAGVRVRPVLARLPAAPPVPSLTSASFARFYTPLALTALFALLVQPIGAAAVGRMPRALESLAVWPPLHGVVFMVGSFSVAYTEVVIALIGEPGAAAPLRRFARRLSLGTLCLLLLVAWTPASRLWFGVVSGLPPRLADVGVRALRIAPAIPALAAFQSLFQGALVSAGRTRSVVAGDALYLLVATGLLSAGVGWGGATGIYVSLSSFAAALCAQVLWLRRRSRPILA